MHWFQIKCNFASIPEVHICCMFHVHLQILGKLIGMAYTMDLHFGTIPMYSRYSTEWYK